MKKILKIISPSILVFLLLYLGRHNKDLILTGIYILYPLIYLITSLINAKKELIISLVLLSITFLIPINVWFNMGACIDLVIIYNILACISYFIKRKIKK
jgi:hypothetical protein